MNIRYLSYDQRKTLAIMYAANAGDNRGSLPVSHA